jgi:hypothetical protein
MAGPPSPVPPPELDGALLHQRLLAGAATAPSQIAVAYVDCLAAWLAAKNPHAPEHFRVEAASEAVLALIRNPASYDPRRLGLFEYLRMAAQYDLLNLLARERKHHIAASIGKLSKMRPAAGNTWGGTTTPPCRSASPRPRPPRKTLPWRRSTPRPARSSGACWS